MPSGGGEGDLMFHFHFHRGRSIKQGRDFWVFRLQNIFKEKVYQK